MSSGQRDHPSSWGHGSSTSTTDVETGSARFLQEPSFRLSSLMNPATTMDPSRTTSQPLPRRSQTVIDLTADEPSVPARRTTEPSSRSRVDIIDVDAIPERHEPTSPEVEFTFSRQVHPSLNHRRPPRPAHPIEPSLQRGTFGVDAANLRNLSAARFPPASDSNHRYMSRAIWAGTFSFLQRLPLARSQAPQVNFERHDEMERRFGYSAPRRGPSGTGPVDDLEGFIPPSMLPYDAVALHEESRSPPPSPPTYSAPKEARAGFTRSPQEDDTILCPNCGDELGVGDTAEKRSVWFVKGCGHVSFLPSRHDQVQS